MAAFVTTLPIRFHELDSAGIVYYPRFFDYFHMAFEDFFGAESGAPYHVWIKERRIGWPTVHIESDFVSPLKYGMQVRVELSFPELGTSSFKARYQAFDAATGTLSCSCLITVVSTDLVGFRPVPIPPPVRAALERFASEERTGEPGLQVI